MALLGKARRGLAGQGGAGQGTARQGVQAMRIRTILTGTTPLVMHNVQLADPDNKIVKEIAAITGKRKKTEADRQEIARLEWFGGLYVGPQGPVIPTANIRRCFQESAKINRLGRAVTRGVISLTIQVPLIYDGPRNIKELWDHEEFRYLTPVGVGTSTVMRMRPAFPNWALECEWEMIESVIPDLETLVAVVEQAGVVEGLGDNRINGYGRFSVAVAGL